MCQQMLFMFSVGLSRLYGVVLFTLLIASIELEACTFVYTNPDVIVASAESLFNTSSNATEWQCTYLVKAAQPTVTITLELTSLSGFSEIRSRSTSVNCIPRLDIYEVDQFGAEEHVAHACKGDNVKLPKVFHISTSLAKIVFTWPSDDRRGEFKMNVIFLGASDTSKQWLAAILGIAAVGLLCGIVAYFIRSRSNCTCTCCCCQNRGGHSALDQKTDATSDASRILQAKDKATCDGHRPHAGSDSDDNLDVPIPQRPAGRHHHQVQQQPCQLPSKQQQQLLDNMRFPPPVPRSLDGEEREYWAYQKYLKYDGACESNYVELYKPPPNKTVADCESPPPCPSRTRVLPPDPRLGAVV